MIQLSRADCKQVALMADHIKARAEKIDDEVNKRVESLANEAAAVATAGYALGTVYGVKDIPHVYTDQDKQLYGDSWFVIANGKEVTFLEFGAGIAADSQHPWGDQIGGVSPGAWSETHARQFVEKGYWYYDKTSWSFIPATRAMYNASLHIRQKIESGEWLQGEVN